jgi:hypothetical protein
MLGALAAISLSGCSSRGGSGESPRRDTAPTTNRTQPSAPQVIEIAPVPQPSAGFRIVSFAEAFPQVVNGTLPLFVSLPQGYSYSPLKTQNSHLWAPPVAAGDIARGVRPEQFLTLQAIRSNTITFSPGAQQFTCGPDCNEAQAIRSLEDENTKVVSSARHTINGAAVLFLELQNLKPRPNQRKRGYAAFVAGGANNEVVLISVRSAAKDEKAAEPVWAELKRVMVESHNAFRR